MKRKTIIIIVSIVVVLVALALAFGKRKDEREVTVSPVTRRNLVESVMASGKIQPETEIKIQSQISGQIIELPVKEGDVVKKGQLLVKINPDLFISALNRADAALNSAKSNLASSKARLAQAEAQLKVQEFNYNRQKTLFADKAISQAELDNATGSFETARAEVTAAKETINGAAFSIESAMASRIEASDNLSRTTILATMDGTVTALTKEIGETVLGNSMMSGDVIMRISALNSMEVNVEVNESDIVRVNAGDTALVRVDAYKDRKFKGLVTEIGNTALNALGNTGAALSMDQVTNFSVKVRILASSYEDLAVDQPVGYSPFRPGMSADVEIQTSQETSVLTIPIKAVASREDTAEVAGFKLRKETTSDEADAPKEPLTVVFIFNESTNTSDLRVVKTGIQDDRFIHILQGVNENEKVITGPYDEVSRKLKKGDKVKVKSPQKATKDDDK
jgi:HlyD family secretion protein